MCLLATSPVLVAKKLARVRHATGCLANSADTVRQACILACQNVSLAIFTEHVVMPQDLYTNNSRSSRQSLRMTSRLSIGEDLMNSEKRGQYLLIDIVVLLGFSALGC